MPRNLLRQALWTRRSRPEGRSRLARHDGRAAFNEAEDVRKRPTDRPPGETATIGKEPCGLEAVHIAPAQPGEAQYLRTPQ
jgi:hypothetical protein